jgi:methionyl-tRNA synthetase
LITKEAAMSAASIYLSTTIPYVNGRPHLGHALELVQADVLARHFRQAGDQVRFQTGTDDNALKNVLAAQAEGISPADLVERNASAFAGLREPLGLSFDDFIRTGSDPRHKPGVDRLWRACEASGDFYLKHYVGLYCVGCEQFYQPAELPGGRCPEHGTRPQQVTEENWFFRLSRYCNALRELISSGRLRIEPAARRNEVLGFIAGGLEDFSVSRPAARSRGWGIGVPGDPSQVIYVWWDALANYITALGYGTGAGAYQRWWKGSDRRIHLVGKGVLRFHAVYWPAILLSAREPLPTDIVVHDYLTINGNKISKSDAGAGGAAGATGGAGAGAGGAAGATGGAGAGAGGAAGATGGAGAGAGGGGGREASESGGAADGGGSPAALVRAEPAALADRYGTDAVRWWLLREVPRVGDTDFTPARLVARANEDLANGAGNLISRVVTLVHKYRDGRVPVPDPASQPDPDALRLRAAGQNAAGAVAAALAAFDFRAAAAAVWVIVEAANGHIDRVAPWHLARAERDGNVTAGRQLDAALAELIGAGRSLAAELAPFLPGLAAGIGAACDDSAGRLPPPRPLFPRLS